MMKPLRETRSFGDDLEGKSPDGAGQPLFLQNNFAVIMDSVEKSARKNVARQLADCLQLSEKEAAAVILQTPIVLRDRLSEQEAIKIKNKIAGPGAEVVLSNDPIRKKACYKIIWSESPPAGGPKSSSAILAQAQTEQEPLANLTRERIPPVHPSPEKTVLNSTKTLIAAAPSGADDSAGCNQKSALDKLTAELAETRTQLEQVLSTSLETSSYWIREKNNLQTRIETLENQVSAKTAEAEDLARRHSEAEKQCEQIRQALQQTERKIAEADEEKRKILQSSEELRERFLAADARLETALNDVRSAENQKREIEAELNLLRTSLESAQQEASEASERVRQIITRQEHEMGQWQEALQRERDHIANLQTELSETREKLNVQTRETAEQLETTAQKQRYAEAERDELKKACEELRKQSENAAEEIRLLTEKQNCDTRQWQEALQRERDHIANLQTELSETREKLNVQTRETAEQLETTAQKYRSAESERDTLKAEIASLRERSDPAAAKEMQQKLELQASELSRWQEIVQQEQRRIREVQSQFEQERAKFQRQSTDAEEENAALTQRLRKAESDLDSELKKQAQSHHEEHESLIREIKRLQSEISRFEKAGLELEHWKSECALWRDRHTALEQIKDGLISRLREEEEKSAQRSLEISASLESPSSAAAAPSPRECQLAEQLEIEKHRCEKLEQEYHEIKKRLDESPRAPRPSAGTPLIQGATEMSLLLALEDQQSEAKKWKLKAEELQKELAQISERLQFLK